MRPGSKLKRIDVYLPESLMLIYTELAKAAAREGVSVSVMARTVLLRWARGRRK